jgi:putrescine transport system permease protein
VMGLLNPTGYVNQFLLFLGLIDTPLDLMRMDISVYFGIVICYLPLMVLPLYAVLVRIDESLYEAATDLGATRTTTFMTITLPMARAGIVAGCLLVFIPAMGEFMIPELLGGPEQLMMGKVLWAEFFRSRDWPVAAALAVLLLLVLSIPILWLRHAERRMKET